MDPEQTGGPVSYNSSPGGRKHILLIVVLIVLLLAALGGGGWAFTQMQDYKKNSDQKAAAAVDTAKKDQAVQLQTQFNEQNKSPFKTFSGSATYGSVTFAYPKTWSGYVDTSNTSEPINGYFQPDIVPGLQSHSAYALRVELLNNDYSQVTQQYLSNTQQGKITQKAYVPPKMQGAANVTTGVYLTGQINTQEQNQNGAMVIIKVRDKTLQISTQSNEYINDFNNILNTLTFSP
jgi:hypothetical protein